MRRHTMKAKNVTLVYNRAFDNKNVYRLSELRNVDEKFLPLCKKPKTVIIPDYISSDKPKNFEVTLVQPERLLVELSNKHIILFTEYLNNIVHYTTDKIFPMKVVFEKL